MNVQFLCISAGLKEKKISCGTIGEDSFWRKWVKQKNNH